MRQHIAPILAALSLVSAAALPPAHAAKAPAAQPKVEFVTTMGNFVVQLDPARAPKTVANFLDYVKSGFYKGTIFHRVIPGFMVQGGGFTADMQKKPTRAPIPLESQNGLRNLKGTIAMARTSDPNSATSQFFVNVVDNPSLDYPKPDGYGYAVFGKVISGMNVIEKIVAVPTKNEGMFQDVPVKPIVIEDAKLLN
ncbi:peptidylprolyl isomerase [Thiomonas arsenitoxydans]|nr:peptidylprolyl isomerase [Thiomonas arsenitoxydans]CAZ87189.1 Peptidyl-prolyl cis-trans isomerase A precursor (PPIase A) (Rotamase A) (Cyclophilin A) [Thiomonas arsenitoxydans]